ncbi:ATP-binding cassette domain-containing protein [Rhizobium leguminosarum]|uniref:ATP-binding cassette domain-containing protein n=1 Tax=Rhizobium leguminosarum TaxID=384 RepID=A0A4Q8XNL7_RHILE|nr:ATP-binding cassette domain-containing protein [Rhizobium leguminosarum]TAX64123.1 ATP-binding cassette domain-containing protein [Rhizobium leguminosarum]
MIPKPDEGNAIGEPSMKVSGDCIFRVAGAERHLSDGQRRTEIRLEQIEMRAGETYALCGPSGIGKTTALEILSLACRPDVPGHMVFSAEGRSVDLHDLASRKGGDALAAIRGRSFGYVVQTAHLFPFLTVQENIELAQRIAGRRDPVFGEWLMDELQISGLAASFPNHLSGGQRQRVCVARALAHRPAIVLADEPTSAVDQEIANRIMALLVGYAEEYAAGVLVITHNVELVRRFALKELSIESSVSHGVQRTVIGGPGFVMEPVLRREGANDMRGPVT